MHVIGLTGGIGTGKSTVARLLSELGVAVVDADQLARQVVMPGSPVLDALVQAFAPADILDESGGLDRAAMRRRISQDVGAKRVLDGIMHPAIREALQERLSTLRTLGTKHAVVEAALLVETGSYRQYPTLMVVTCEPETQLQRVMSRDSTTAEAAQALIARQLPLAVKEAAATHLIRNDGDLDTLRSITRDVWASIKSSLST